MYKTQLAYLERAIVFSLFFGSEMGGFLLSFFGSLGMLELIFSFFPSRISWLYKHLFNMDFLCQISFNIYFAFVITICQNAFLHLTSNSVLQFLRSYSHWLDFLSDEVNSFVSSLKAKKHK